jgi:hypothetical protein
MPIENDFLPFAIGGSANVEAQSTWATDTVLLAGFASGIANSSQANKAWRQASIIASMVAQFIVDHSGQPAIDNGTTATLETNLLAAINAVIALFVANALGAGGTAYTPQFNALSANGYDAAGAGQLRLVYGNYGAIFRMDTGNLYILLTNSGSATGTYNALRPLSINLATGALSLDGTGAGTTFGGSIHAASSSISGGETVTGTLTAGALLTAGGVTALNANFSGGVTAVNATVTGNTVLATLSAASATVTGTTALGAVSATGLTVGNVTVSGGITSLNANFTGVVTFNGTAIAVALTATNATVTGGITALNANFTGVVTLNGTTTAVTPATGNRSTQVATTAMFANEFALNPAGNGYQKLPSGLLLQWGQFQINQGTTATFNFPLAFPNACLNCVVSFGSGISGLATPGTLGCDPISVSQFQVALASPSGSVLLGFRFHAIGY